MLASRKNQLKHRPPNNLTEFKNGIILLDLLSLQKSKHLLSFFLGFLYWTHRLNIWQGWLYFIICGNWTSQEITVAAWEGNIFLFSHIFYLKSFAVILMLYTFLQTNINSYNAKKSVPWIITRERRKRLWLADKVFGNRVGSKRKLLLCFFVNKKGRRRSRFNYFWDRKGSKLITQCIIH